MGDVVLLTGGTGFVGTEVAGRLLERPDLEIVSLVRARDDAEAEHASLRAWWFRPDLRAALGGRIRVVAGDVSETGLGLDPATHAHLRDRVTHVVHAAADLRVEASVEDLRRTNVEGVANVLDFARSIHRLRRLLHVSTAYVAGRRSGTVSEDDLTDAFGFHSPYEKTKFEGERLVRAAASQVPVTIVRPAMIVGDSRTGDVKTFNTFYTPMRLLLSGRFRIVPARRDLRVNIVPVDYVADAIVRLTFDPAAAGSTFHLTSPTDRLPTAGEVVAATRRWARANLGIRVPAPLFLPVGPRVGGRTDRVLAPYFRERRRFRRDHTDEVLGPSVPDWRTYLPILLDHATARGFLHRSDRTVHEQVLFRLRSRHLSVRLVDVDADDGRSVRAAADVRHEIASAVAALRAMGVGRGTRVAIVGSNSTRYLVVDVAVGLVGAVSVPLYVTTPPPDLDDVLRRSRAEILFVGAPAMLERLAELSTRLPVVSFCRDGPERDDVIGYRSFLASGGDAAVPGPAPVGPDDLATIRYTSGTTGPPKGVAFTHAQLRWMAETMASLLPWAARTRPARYLSFLPMNHVVEGILGTYGPYDLPAPVEVTFLEDLRRVASILPSVRPTVFFAVPRVYQKVWEALGRNKLGARYQGMREGSSRRGALRPLVRRALLRRAGLDRCVQLLAGSAPVDEQLLRSFRELGIEVHVAYGLTEAPLVALNRLGRNRIGTVGELLPETQVQIAGDGEVLVRGPQVMSGYVDVDEGEQPIHDGWLSTGDLGHQSGDGYLVVDGRKKDLLKTAYGKYLQPGKIEALLRRIPDVSEAMVVGEGRPFCAALLWVEDVDDTAAIDAAVADANRGLSHPEQVKRWAVLPNDLSIEGGDLTANLKLKRRQVEARFRDVIESLYGSAPIPSTPRVREPV